MNLNCAHFAKRTTAAAALAASLAVTSLAFASEGRPVSVAERIQGADTVVVATATSVNATWRENDEGLRFAARAIKADPTCWHCYATLARLLYGKRALDEAVVAGERARNLLPDGVKNPELADMVMRYAEERNRARRAKAPVPTPEKAPSP